MTERRRAAQDRVFGQAAYARVLERIETGQNRVEELFNRVDDRLLRIERDLAARELGEQRTVGDVTELRRDIGELRDAVHLGEGRRVEAAAKGAAAGAVTGAKTFWGSFWGGAVKIAVGFAAIVVAFTYVPKATRGVEHAWAILRGDYAPREPAKQDKTDGA